MGKIRTIIFDLGGVVINLYVEKTISAFARLSGWSESEVEAAYLSAEVFKEYETGMISDVKFRKRLQQQFNLKATDHEIDDAWNSMLGEIPQDRIKSVQELMRNYKCIVLSNTNSIHETEFHKILSKSFPYRHLEDIFHETYFSHKLNQRKPNRDIYRNVLRLSQTEASGALFMDDSQANLEAASKEGIQVLHIPRNGGFMTLLEKKLSEI